ncbi:Arc family DNA-binding protein [Devosia rhizosphaerae]|uniref:Arc family DNA-binding protein n=1 Tax=Devosia rhizosphaerae TaxID=3049774 RepID=UPI0039F4B903
MAAPKQTDPQFKLRLTPELKENIEAEAAKNNRSMNAEILHRLELSFDWPVISTALRNALEESADANRQSIQQEILARLEFTQHWDSDFFNPASDNARGLDPDHRISAVENRLDELSRLIRKLVGEPDPLSQPMFPAEGTDDKPF